MSSALQPPAGLEKAGEPAESSNASFTKPASGGASSTSLPHADGAAAEKAEPAGHDAEAPVRTVTGWAWFLVVLAILSSTFLFALDNTVVADVQPAIIERFDEIEKLPWLTVAFLLGAIATNLFWGKVYGQFNAKWLYIGNVVLFEAGSALCGGAPNMNALIVGRALCGIGGAGLYVGVMTLLSISTTPHERPTYIGLTGLTWGAGTVLGPVVGGAFADSSATWRWAFYINLVVGGLFAPICLFLLPSKDPRPGVPWTKRLGELDFTGTVLVTGALTSGVMAISFGGITYDWNSGRIIGLFVCSGVLFILFGLQQAWAILTTEEHRIFPVPFLKNRDMVLLFVLTACAITSTFLPIYFIPIFFQFTRGDSALDAGVRLLPYVCLLVFFCILNGAMMSKFGYYMPWYVFGGAFALIGGALMYTVDEFTSTSAIYGYSVLLATGAGSYCQTSFSVAQAKVAPQEISMAIGFITLGQLGGGTVALAIANSLFLNQSTAKIVRLLPGVPLETVRNAISGAGSALFKSLSPELRAEVLAAIVASIGRVYILVITAAALSIVVSVFLKREKLFMEMGGAA
ncbi:MAG: hypothetical protein M1832_003817 [Thelocarpon impressellum]|nr:MAG: hypothetical protein M1832_003817 [Thelocarpon impressellum]